MKKKAVRVITVILFWVVFCILFFRISEIFRLKSGGGADRVHSLYGIEEDTVDVLAIGSSHAYYGFSPNELWGNYGITSYVMGSPAQTTAISYYLLEEFLQYQTPKVVLLESYSFKYDSLHSGTAMLRQAIDGIPLGKEKLEMVEELLPDLSFEKKMTFYLPFLKYHGRWSELKNYDFHQTRACLHGAILKKESNAFEDPGMDVEPQELPELSIYYFERIRQLCEENGIELIVFAVPMVFLDESIYDYAQGINLSLEDYLEDCGVPFLFFQKENEIGFDFATDMWSRGHVNLSGQIKTTLGIGNYLQDHYDFVDHRDDPAYAQWEEDYQTYLELKEQDSQEDAEELEEDAGSDEG